MPSPDRRDTNGVPVAGHHRQGPSPQQNEAQDPALPDTSILAKVVPPHGNLMTQCHCE